MLKNFLADVAELLTPDDLTCDICGTEVFDGGNLCTTCKGTMVRNDGICCPVCGRKVQREETCFECKQLAPLYDKAASVFCYDGGARDLILKFKNGQAYLKRYLCSELLTKFSSLPTCDLMVCVPVSAARVRERGYNQAQVLCEELAKRTGVAFDKDVLQKVKDTTDQKALTRRERSENLKGCFRVHKRTACKGKDILLVDDVLTTGATADSIAALLKGAGAKHVYLLTVASVQYKLMKDEKSSTAI